MSQPLPLMEEEEEHGQDEEGEERSGGGVSCGFCGEWRAVVHCNADDANLCLSCDRQVHSANTVSSKHNRSLLCNSCCSASSTIHCHTHRLVLCQSCDFEVHPEGLEHDRRPIEPFSGCPGAVEMISVLGLGEDEKNLDLDGGGGDGSVGVGGNWVWETPLVLSLDDLVVPTTAEHGLQAVGVPPLPKDRNVSCGRQKEEILRQIRDLIKSEEWMLNQNWNHEENIELRCAEEQQRFQTDNWDLNCNDANGDFQPNCQNDILHWQNDCSEATNSVMFPLDDLLGMPTADNQQLPDGLDGTYSCTNQDNASETDGGHLISTDDTHFPPKVAYELSGPDRDSAISRYREKRKTRRYDKHVRYESRRARAEGRVRIKGRFAKLNPGAKS